MKYNKILNCLSLILIVSLLGACGDKPSDSVSSNDSPSISTSDTNTSSEVESLPSNSVESLPSESDGNFVSIDDVSTLFDTYATNEEYDFMAKYQCDQISNREYLGGWETTYMYDGINLLLTYEASGVNYTDFYIYDETTEQMIYYLDSGNGLYKYLDEDNEDYLSFVSYIDWFELAGIDWEEDMIFDLENKVAIPKDQAAKDRIGRIMFGDNPNEYWHEIKVTWNENYITNIDAVSIYRETNYYYSVELSEHGYTTGSVVVPDNVIEYVNPYQPYLKDKEVYTGGALSEAQATALNNFANEYEMNYTVDIKWEAVYDGVLEENAPYLDFKLLADKGNYEYSYVDTQSAVLTHYFYLLSNSENPGSAPVCFIDEDFDGAFTPITSGMDEYEGYVSQIMLDRVLLYGLNPEDFIYDEEKGYITAKDAKTEAQYCENLFYYADTYAGLRIYLKDDNGSLVLDKIVTSMFFADEAGNAYSFYKTYTFSNINSTTITYPDGVTLS